jgi:hypothetical protein
MPMFGPAQRARSHLALAVDRADFHALLYKRSVSRAMGEPMFSADFLRVDRLSPL